MTDAQVIAAMYHEAMRDNAQLRADLAIARQHAQQWEATAKDLRKEIQRLRMECDTDVINRGSK